MKEHSSMRRNPPYSLALFLLIILALFTVSCDSRKPQVDMEKVAPVASNAPAGNPKKVLRIAVAAMISPETTRTYYEELLRLISRRMGREAVFVQRRTYGEVNSLVKNREVDVAFVCSGPYTEGHDEFGMEIIAVPVVHGEKVYHSYIIVPHDSPYSSFADLRGHKFAFVDEGSNSGYLVPAYMLAKRGEKIPTYFSEFFFTHSHDNSIKAVADELADGAAVDSLIWEFFNTINPELTGRTKIIEKSPPYGIPPVVVPAGLDSELKKQLKHVFLSLHEDREAAALMKKLQIDRFAEGNDGMYNTVRAMNRWLKTRESEQR
ncbi:MAG: phosphate/phosphite/phosphonate ABC transporter substrate-binding protein [Geobacter sp.]|nr:MAG: phosphate/phosphite/phosphonate ABC transporter substrate-binding protein [Geobacter sp.]